MYILYRFGEIKQRTGRIQIEKQPTLMDHASLVPGSVSVKLATNTQNTTNNKQCHLPKREEQSSVQLLLE